MTDAEKLEKLRRELRPIIDWYRNILENGSPDGDEDPRDYLYDETWRAMRPLSRGAHQLIIETLL